MPYAVCFSLVTRHKPLVTAASPLLPNRHADPMDLLWMTLGAFAGALASALASMFMVSSGD
jgi:hypothetical protein